MAQNPQNKSPKYSSPILECKNLSKAFDQHFVLKDVNLEIPRSKIVGLLGQNGAGKSTLIKLINDLLVPTTSEILVDGQPIGIHSKEIIAYLPERTYLDRSMTVRAAIAFFSEFYSNFDSQKAEALVKELDLKLDQHITKMSKGMQEKLQLILVMSRQAKLYVLDEPLGGVDPATRDYILDTILSNFSDGASVLISTHLITDIERILDEVIFIENGRITLIDNADRLRNQHYTSIDAIFRKTFRPKTN